MLVGQLGKWAGFFVSVFLVAGCSANEIENLRYGNIAFSGHPEFVQEGSGNRLKFVDNARPSAGYYAVVARYVSPRDEVRLPARLVRGEDDSLDLGSLCSSLTELNFKRKDIATVSMVTGNTNRFGQSQAIDEQLIFEFHMLSANSDRGGKCIEGTKEYHLSPVKVWNNQYPVKIDVKFVSSSDVTIPVGEAVNVIVGVANAAKNVFDPTGGAVFSLSSLQKSETIGAKVQRTLSNGLSLEAEALKTLTFFRNASDKANTKYVPLLARVQLEDEKIPREMNAGYIEVRVVVAPSVMTVKSWRQNGYPDLSNTVNSELAENLRVNVNNQQLGFEDAVRLLFSQKGVAVGNGTNKIVDANIIDDVCDSMLEGLPFQLSDIDRVILVEKFYELVGVEEYPPVQQAFATDAPDSELRPEYLKHLSKLQSYHAQFKTNCFEKYAYIYSETAMRYRESGPKAQDQISIVQQKIASLSE